MASPDHAAPPVPKGRLQVINEAKEFSSEIASYMRNIWHVSDKGFSYNVVAVFGSQSTGKSTLLNRVFGTQFSTMDEQIRQQTTKGIWMSRAEGERDLLVLDVEGTDGREKGEDKDFERKSALFSLAIAEVLIINMWENMVGLYSGANLGLLRTVFEVNLQLFQAPGSPKTNLLFVLRDFTGVTPLENLAATLRKDLENIWEGLSKPAGKESATMDDFFELQFFGIPHKVFAAEPFNQGCAQLRTWFMDPEHASYVFRPQFHKHIPADGFPAYAEAIWDKVLTNKDLDLPSQQELLAQFRCDEIAREALAGFTATVGPLHAPLESGQLVATLGETMQTALHTALTAFDKDASRYHKPVYTRRRADFRDQMVDQLHSLFTQYVRNLHQRTVQAFAAALLHAAKPPTVAHLFADALTKARAEAVDGWDQAVAAAMVDDVAWTTTEFRAQLETELNSITATRRRKVIDHLVSQLVKTQSEAMDQQVLAALDAATSQSWSLIAKAFHHASGVLSQQFTSQSACLALTADEQHAAAQQLMATLWVHLVTQLKWETSEVPVGDRLRSRFREAFCYEGASRTPRIWKPSDDMETVFAQAKQRAEAWIVRFRAMDFAAGALPATLQDAVATSEIGADLDPDMGVGHLVLIDSAREKRYLELLSLEADAMYLNAKRSMLPTTREIPNWLWLVLLALGWNELWSVLSNPMYFLLLGIAGAVTYGIYAAGLTGPTFRVVKAATSEISTQITSGLKERGVHVDDVRKRLAQAIHKPDDIELHTMRSDKPHRAPAMTAAAKSSSSSRTASSSSASTTSSSSGFKSGVSHIHVQQGTATAAAPGKAKTSPLPTPRPLSSGMSLDELRAASARRKEAAAKAKAAAAAAGGEAAPASGITQRKHAATVSRAEGLSGTRPLNP